MNFASVEFFVLLGLSAVLCRCLRPPARPWLLLAASLVFYAYGNLRFLGLIAALAGASYLLALDLARRPEGGRKRLVLAAGWLINFGCLLGYKIAPLLKAPASGSAAQGVFLSDEILVPLGMSFFTFQAVGYLTDVYHGRIEAERSPGRLFLFLLFFPQLLSGPIESARALMPQLRSSLTVSRVSVTKAAPWLILGLFKKLYVANSLGPFVDHVFSESSPGAGLIYLGCLTFAVQLYADFSGYCDLAMGAAAIFGISLSANFKAPFASASPAEFWQRWHITLNRWLRDYIHVPLARSFPSVPVSLWSAFGFVLAGLWHGFSTNFLLMGLYFAGVHLFFLHVLAPRLSGPLRRRFGWVYTTQSFVLGMFLFRGGSVANLIRLAQGATASVGFGENFTNAFSYMSPFLIALAAAELFFSGSWSSRAPAILRHWAWGLCLGAAWFLGRAGSAPFVYFKF